MKSKQNLTSLIIETYSHIYIEKEAEAYPVAKRVKDILNKSQVIEIGHYKDVFSESGQDFLFQKKSPKLILAVKRENFYYKGSPMCNNYGNENFYYASSAMNCPYNCDYCYLQGMYSSANMVIFVNISDTLKSVKQLAPQKPLISVSYDTDLLAMEKLTGFVGEWIGFCHENKETTIEIRTKSADFSVLEMYEPPDNLVLSVTVSPEEIISLYEKKTPKLDLRINFINRAAKSGWKPRICIDPVLYVEDYEIIYKEFIKHLFFHVDMEKITDVSFGMLRLPKDFFKRTERLNAYSKLFAYPFVNNSGALTYSKEHAEKLQSCIYKGLSCFLPENKINYYSP